MKQTEIGQAKLEQAAELIEDSKQAVDIATTAKESVRAAHEAMKHVSKVDSITEQLSVAAKGLSILSGTISLLTSPYILYHGSKPGGEFHPWSKHKLKVSVQIVKIVGAAAAIALSVAALAIPGVAPTLAIAGAAIGAYGIAHDLGVSLRQYWRAKSKLKTLNELETREKEPTQCHPLNEQEKIQLEELKPMREELIKRSSKGFELGIKISSMIGGTLFVVGLGLANPLGPVGLIIATVGASIAGAGAAVKGISMLADWAKNRFSTKNVEHAHPITHEQIVPISQDEIIPVTTETKLQTIHELLDKVSNPVLRIKIEDILSANKAFTLTGDFYLAGRQLKKLAVEFHPDKQESHSSTDFLQLQAIREAIASDGTQHQKPILAIKSSDTIMHESIMHAALLHEEEHEGHILTHEGAKKLSHDYHEAVTKLRAEPRQHSDSISPVTSSLQEYESDDEGASDSRLTL